MGAHSRSKGKRGEREVVALARAAGLDASREWQNAQHPDAAMRRCDVVLDGRPAQVKVSGDGFGYLYDGLQAVEFVGAGRGAWQKGRVSAKAERQKERNAPRLTRRTFCDNKKGSNEQANGKATEGD